MNAKILQILITMEEFNKINWNQPPDDTTFVSAEELIKKSLVYRIFNNSFRSYLSSDSSDESFEEVEVKKVATKAKKKKKKQGSPKKAVVKPDESWDGKPIVGEDGIRYSSFSSAQHAEFLEMLLAAQSQIVNISPEFGVIKVAFEKEQKDFQDHLKNVWTSSFEKHFLLPDDAQKYTTERWKSQLKRVKSYPQLYKLKKTIPLIYPSNSPEVEIVPVKMLLEMGVVPKLQIPNLELFPGLNTSYTQMLLLNASRPEDIDSLLNKSVSMDRNAIHLALKEKAHIVISSSGLKCIADNVSLNSDRVWTMPVVIKQYKVKDGNSVKYHKIVFIDKKLPPKSMSSYERNVWFHKHAVKSFLCHPGDPQSFRFPENEDIDMVVEIIEEELNCFPNRKTAENGGICPKCSLPKEGKENDIEREDSDSESNSSLVIDMETEECDKSLNICTCFTGGGEEKGDPLQYGSSLPIPPTSKSNITYRLWKLHCGERNKEDLNVGLLKHSSLNQELNILVRCKMDACETESNAVGPVCLSSKLEFQAEHGAEKLNLSMLVKEWVSLLFRPEASLTRIHINAVNEEIILTEKSQIRDLTLLASSLFNFHIKRRIVGSLYQIMSDLYSLIPGHYLLSHDTRSGPFITVLQQTNENFTYDLYADYESVNPTIFNKHYVPQWTPIDTAIITPLHITTKQVPGTFKPCK